MTLPNFDSWIANPETGERKQMIIEGFPLKGKDFLIGGGLITLGIGYLTYKAYRKGVFAFQEAEYKALDALGLLK